MKKFNILLSLILSTNIWALDLEEALNISLDNNFDILTKTYEYKQSKQNINLNRSSLLPSFDLSYSYNKRNEVLSSQDKEDSTASATLSYNLFNGFKDLKNFSSAKYLSSSSKFTLEASKEDILFQTKELYISVLEKRRSLTTYEDAYKLFLKQYADANNKHNEGILAKNDLLKVQVNTLDAKQDVIKARSDLQISRYELSNILGGYDLTNVLIKDLSLDKLNKNFSDENLENRSELLALKMDIKSAKANVSSSKSGFYPKVDASISYNKYGDDKGFGGSSSYPESQQIANVSLSWNLFSGAYDKSLIGINKSKVHQALIALDKTRLDIKLQYQNAISSYEVAKVNFETSTISLEQAQLNYEIVDNRFKEGLSSTTDLVDANYLLSSSKHRYYSSYYDNFLAIARLERITQSK